MKGKHLRKVDFPSDIAKSVAINIMTKHYKHVSMEEKLEIIKIVLLNPEQYVEHEHLSSLARAFRERLISDISCSRESRLFPERIS